MNYDFSILKKKDKEGHLQRKRKLRAHEKITAKRIRITYTLNSYFQNSVNFKSSELDEVLDKLDKAEKYEILLWTINEITTDHKSVKWVVCILCTENGYFFCGRIDYDKIMEHDKDYNDQEFR